MHDLGEAQEGAAQLGRLVETRIKLMGNIEVIFRAFARITGIYGRGIACADEITWNMRQWAAAQAKMGKKAYTYFFTRIPTLNGQPSPNGATHTAEISYAFNNPKGQANQTWDDVDTKLADTMSSYWVNFITKGDPNGSGLPNWPQYRDINSKVMVFGNTVQAEAAPPVDKLKFYAAAYQRLLRLGGN